MNVDRLRAILRRVGVEHTVLSPSGWLHGQCPLAQWTHERGHDRNPSFAAKPEENGISAFMCWTCKRHGRISGLVRMLHAFGAPGIDLDDHGYPLLAREADIADNEGLADRPFGYVPEEQDVLPDPLDEVVFEGVFITAWDVPEARTYIQGRGVSEEASYAMSIGWDPDQRRVVFPVRDRQGRLYGFTGRAVDQEVQPKVRDYYGLPKRHLVLGEDRWTGQPGDGRPLVIVEGLFGRAHLVTMGLEGYADVGCLLGSNMTQHKADRITARGGPTYLLLDNDSAGEDGLFGPLDQHSGERDFDRGAVAMLYRHVPLFVPAWPAGKDDPDELTKTEVWSMLRDTPMYGGQR